MPGSKTTPSTSSSKSSLNKQPTVDALLKSAKTQLMTDSSNSSVTDANKPKTVTGKTVTVKTPKRASVTTLLSFANKSDTLQSPAKSTDSPITESTENKQKSFIQFTEKLAPKTTESKKESIQATTVKKPSIQTTSAKPAKRVTATTLITFNKTDETKKNQMIHATDQEILKSPVEVKSPLPEPSIQNEFSQTSSSSSSSKLPTTPKSVNRAAHVQTPPKGSPNNNRPPKRVHVTTLTTFKKNDDKGI